MTREEKAKLARKARRKPGNEASLFWATSGVVAMFGFLGYFPAPLLEALGLHIDIMALSIIVGIVVGGLLALVYFLLARKSVAKAIFANNAVMKIERDKRQAEVEAKMDKMKESADA